MNKAIFIAILAGGKGCDGTMEELLQQNQTAQFVRLLTTGTRNILFTSGCQCLKKLTNLTLAHKLGAGHSCKLNSSRRDGRERHTIE
jgi:hypothetical protein